MDNISELQSRIDQENENIQERYKKRTDNERYEFLGKNLFFTHYSLAERELRFSRIIKKKFSSARNLKLIEVGAGAGNNLAIFKKMGFKWKDLYANELLEDRFFVLKENLPSCVLHQGDALELNYKENFDIVFQSTVFTSVLDMEIKKMLAKKMLEMTKPGGIVLWYDFKFDNPSNKDVKGVDKNEIKSLFNFAPKIEFYAVTLAPPIGRRIGRLYSLVNFLFPFLRTHLIAVIHK